MSTPISVVGLGYVGLPLALLAAQKGYDVTGIDRDQAKIKSIRAHKSPFVDEQVTNQLKKYPIEVTEGYNAVSTSKIVIVCVPTPVDKNCIPDLTPVISATTGVAKQLKRGKGQLVIIESTINPGICEEVVLPLIEKESGLTCGRDFYLAHCPERINPGDPKWNVSNIPRVVGGYDETSLQLAVEFYKNVIDAPIRPMASLKEAEAVKVVENSFRDINIAFVNELAMSFTHLGIDVVNVIDGAATKPFAFMPHYPGVGVGGHCIPVDPYYLIEYAKKNGFTHKFLKRAREINNNMPQFTVDRLAGALEKTGHHLTGTPVAVLGLSYKANVGDLRESPSLKLIKLLQAAGAEVTAYDPYINHLEGVRVEDAPDPKKALQHVFRHAEAVVLATNHREFREITGDLLERLRVKVVVDGRNFLDKSDLVAHNIIYQGIGR